MLSLSAGTAMNLVANKSLGSKNIRTRRRSSYRCISAPPFFLTVPAFSDPDLDDESAKESERRTFVKKKKNDPFSDLVHFRRYRQYDTTNMYCTYIEVLIVLTDSLP